MRSSRLHVLLAPTAMLSAHHHKKEPHSKGARGRYKLQSLTASLGSVYRVILHFIRHHQLFTLIFQVISWNYMLKMKENKKKR